MKVFRILLGALMLFNIEVSAQRYTPNPGFFEWTGGRFTYGATMALRDTVSAPGKIDSVGTVIYRPGDTALYLKTPFKWLKVGTGTAATRNVTAVDNISSLASLTGSPDSLVLVKNPLRGGLFYWSTTGTPDNGVTFSGATGYWNRVLPGTWVDAAWWGAVGDGTTVGQQTPINNAIDYCVGHQPKEVRVRSGHYLQDGAIRIKDSVYLNVDPSALVELIPGAGKYQVTNDDMTNGNHHFKISGGRWQGNGLQQVIDTSGSLENKYLGFQFQFNRSTDFKIHDLRCDSFLTFAISIVDCHYADFDNIYFRGYIRNVKNGGGIQGSGTYIRIRNIAGYSDDDLVAALVSRVGFANSGFPGPYYPDLVNCDNWVIENIRTEKHPGSNADSAYTWRAVRLFSANNRQITNFIIQNVTGITRANPIHIDGIIHDGGTLAVKMENIQIRNITCKTLNHVTGRTFGYIGINNIAYGNNFSISGITRRDSLSTYYPMIGITNSGIKNIDVSDVEGINIPNSNGPFLKDSLSTVGNINLNNIYWSDSTFTAAQPIYRKFANASSTPTHINARNIRILTTSTNGVTTNNAAQAKISLNSTDFRSDTTLLRGQDYDQVYHLNVGPFYYLNGKWNGNGAGSFIRNQTESAQVASSWINGVHAANRLRVGFDSTISTTVQTKVTVGFTPTDNSTLMMNLFTFKDTINDAILDSVGGIQFARVNNNALTINTTANGYGYTRAGSSLGNIFGAGADSTSGAIVGRVSLTPPVARIGLFAESNFLNHNSQSAGIRFFTKALGAGGTTEKMRISANGNVGIGTTAPASKLEVNGIVTAPGVTSPATADLALSSGQWVTLNTGGTTRVAVKDDGTIDMGTVTSPFGTILLNVGGNVQTNDAYILSDGTTNGELGLAGPGLFLRTVSNHPLLFRTNDIERLRILNTGEVGIGTQTPGAKLEVAGQVKITGGIPGTGKVLTSDADGLATWQTPSAGATPTLQQVTTAGATTSNTIVATNGQIALTGSTSNMITTNAVGTGAPSFTTRSTGTKFVLYPLVSASLVDYAFGIESNNMWMSIPESVTTRGFKWYAGTTQLMRLRGDGNLGVGVNDPGEKVDINGNVAAIHYRGKSGTPVFNGDAITEQILGTGYSVSVTGNDASMRVIITTGSNPSAGGTIGTITFNTSYASIPNAVWSPSSINSLTDNRIGFSATAPTGITVFGTTTLDPNTQYDYSINVIQ